MDLKAFITAAIAIEGVISWGKTVIADRKIQWPVLVALVISFILVFDMSLNLFDLLSLSENCPLVGQIVTAIAISRGTNYFYELYDRLTNWKRDEAV